MAGLRRSGTERIVLGVSAGLAARLGIEAVWLRLGFAILALASGLGLLVYLALALCMLPPDEPELPFLARVRLNLSLAATEARVLYEHALDRWHEWRRARQGEFGPMPRSRAALGGAAVAIGLGLGLASFGLFDWLNAERVAALGVLLGGVALLRSRRP